MSHQFLQAGLWESITALSRKAKRKYVAVAYLGKGATRLLPLKRGDVLIVDMSLPTVRAGETDPHAIDTYLRRGVEVHSCSNLHAKVFVFDNKAIIGSGNVSENSSKYLVEAALLTTDTDVVASARGFVISLMGERVTPGYVDACKKEYRKESRRNEHGRKSDSKKPTHPRLWVSRIYPMDNDPQREEASNRGWGLAESRLRSKRLYEVTEFSEPDGSRFGQIADIGDLVIQVWREEDGSLQAYPPNRIVNIERYVSQRRARKWLLFLEEPKSPRKIPWRILKATLKKGGLSRAGEHIDREIINPNLQHKVLGLWPTWHER